MNSDVVVFPTTAGIPVNVYTTQLKLRKSEAMGDKENIKTKPKTSLS